MFKKVPHTYVIVFYIIIFATILTWIVPSGEYKREFIDVNGKQREVIIQGTYDTIEGSKQTWHVFSSLYNGFVEKADIVAIILIIGGAFMILTNSKAIDVGILSFLKFTNKFRDKKLFRALGVDNMIIVLIMLIFSSFGAIFGMSEETIAFVIIFVPLSVSMGYDSIVGVCMCFVAAGLGFAGALLNPFTVGIAQEISQLRLFSGIEYRLFCWIIINATGIAFVLFYARKIKSDPKRSPVYKEDEYWRKRGDVDIEGIKYETTIAGWITYGLVSVALIIYSIVFKSTIMSLGFSKIEIPIIPVLSVLFIILGFVTLRKSSHFFVLNILVFSMLFMIVGVMGYGWYFMEIATIFLAMGIVSGMAMNYSADNIVKQFLAGAKDILPAAMIVGLAGGIIEILNDGKIIDTLLYAVSGSMNNLGEVGSVSTMYAFQTFLNLFIPSATAKATLTMPMMSQLSDLINVSRQTTVLAFQFGDGFTNMITPTSGVLLGVLGVAKIPYNKWFKWIGPFMAALIILGLLLLLPTVFLTLSGF